MDGDAELLSGVIQRLRNAHAFDRWTVRRFTRGEHVLMVELGSDAGSVSAGVAHRPKEVAVPSAAAVQEITMQQLVEWARHPSRGADTSLGQRAVGLSVLNALSAPLMPWRAGDPMEILPSRADVVVTVGFFKPAMTKFQGAEVRVIERKPRPRDWEAPPKVTVRFYDPEQFVRALDGADIIFLTGSSFIYGGAAEYLQQSSAVPHVVVIGHTSSFLPQPLFERGATILAGARVEEVESVREQIVSGECASAMHTAGLEKVFVTRRDVDAGSSLPAAQATARATPETDEGG